MEREIRRFAGWARPITVDLAKLPVDVGRRVMTILLPGVQAEHLVEFPNEDAPSDEVLDLRTQFF